MAARQTQRLRQLNAHLAADVVQIESDQGLGLRSLAVPPSFPPSQLALALAFFVENGGSTLMLAECQTSTAMELHSASNLWCSPLNASALVLRCFAGYAVIADAYSSEDLKFMNDLWS
eukprot:SAG31_NODE_23174_length_509_cov_1.746341_1_plen_117_part_10